MNKTEHGNVWECYIKKDASNIWKVIWGWWSLPSWGTAYGCEYNKLQMVRVQQQSVPDVWHGKGRDSGECDTAMLEVWETGARWCNRDGRVKTGRLWMIWVLKLCAERRMKRWLRPWSFWRECGVLNVEIIRTQDTDFSSLLVWCLLIFCLSYRTRVATHRIGGGFNIFLWLTFEPVRNLATRLGFLT